MSPSESLSSSGTESETERMTDFGKFGLQSYSLEPTKSKVPVAYYGRNSTSDFAAYYKTTDHRQPITELPKGSPPTHRPPTTNH